MIQYTPEGKHIKIGLNFSGAPHGFRFLWAWYNFATQTATTYRFRLRLHMKPYIIWEVKRFNVIDSYMLSRDLVMVQREILQDLTAAEETSKRMSDNYVAVKGKFRAQTGVQ